MSTSYSVPAPMPIIASTVKESPLFPDSLSQYFLPTRKLGYKYGAHPTQLALQARRREHQVVGTCPSQTCQWQSDEKAKAKRGTLPTAKERAALHLGNHCFMLHCAFEAHLIQSCCSCQPNNNNDADSTKPIPRTQSVAVPSK